LLRRGEAGHVGTGLGDDHLGDPVADSRDASQPFAGLLKRRDLGVNLRGELGDRGRELINVSEHLGEKPGVVIGEIPRQRPLQIEDLGSHPTLREASQDLRIPLPADKRGQHPPR
jgi:hypothetical protein